MAGAFQTTREIFDKPIWQNIVEFRLFFFIYGMAAFKDDVKIGNIKLKRGQWIRSYRNLQDDLQYIENKSIKKYSLSTIKRTIDKLVKDERLKVEESELGTLFEVLNYNEYQCFDNYKNITKNAERTVMEHSRNSDGTVMEHSRNNNKKVKNVKKDKKVKEYIYYAENIKLTEEEYQKLCNEKGKALTDKAIQFLSAYIIEKGYKTKDHNLTLRRWVFEAVAKSQPVQHMPNVQIQQEKSALEIEMEQAWDKEMEEKKKAYRDENGEIKGTLDLKEVFKKMEG